MRDVRDVRDVREEHDVRLVVVQPEEDESGFGETYAIEIREILRALREGIVRWLAATVALCCIVSGVVIGLHGPDDRSEDVSALIALGPAGTERGPGPSEELPDVTKIASPLVVKEAVARLGLHVGPDRVRSALDITGVLSDETYERISLYHDLFSRSSSLDVVRPLMETDRTATGYIITLDPGRAGVSPEEGVVLLDGILDAYCRSVEAASDLQDALEDAVRVSDYRDHDYAEAVDLFASALDQIRSRVVSAARSDGQDFRSGRTGLNFDDLLRTVDLIRDTGLERAASHIMVNNVTANDLEDQAAYYRWKIRELRERRSVQQARLTALGASIAAYEKDPVVFSVDEGGTMSQIHPSAEGDAYDDMIREALDARQALSSCERTIAYYEDIVEGFQGADQVREEDIETAERYLETLAGQVDALVTAADATIRESRAALDDTVRILIPAAVQTAAVRSWKGDLLRFAGGTGAVAFVCYLAAAVSIGLYRANGVRKSLVAEQRDVRGWSGSAEGS